MDFETWWKKNWTKNIQSTSKLENACRYAFTDGLNVNEAKLKVAVEQIEKIQNMSNFGSPVWIELEVTLKKIKAK